MPYSWQLLIESRPFVYSIFQTQPNGDPSALPGMGATGPFAAQGQIPVPFGGHNGMRAVPPPPMLRGVRPPKPISYQPTEAKEPHDPEAVVTCFIGNIDERVTENLIRTLLQVSFVRLIDWLIDWLFDWLMGLHRFSVDWLLTCELIVWLLTHWRRDIDFSEFCLLFQKCGNVANWKRVHGANNKLQGT